MTTDVTLSAPAKAVDWRQLIRAEYLEMPGLRLTVAQARRFWQLDSRSTAALLQQLVDDEFLTRTGDGAYVRADQN